MGQRKAFNITVEEKRPIAQIKKDLKKAGLEEMQVLEAIGVITGSADEDDTDKLKAVEGVMDVAADIYIDLGPPGSDVTW
ncbi:MAG: hypothetical protein KIT83_21515 [Bryobacterales bacterium]|nr:hypothetical protein [Bryobacterales bacterium]